MFRNLIKIAIRNFWKNKSTTAINITGLSLGMACCFLIILYCNHEFSYDQFHKNSDRLFQVNYHIRLSGEINHARIPPAFGPQLTDYFPEIEATTRFYPRDLSVVIPQNGQQFELQDVYFVDSTAAHVFDFEVIKGDLTSAFSQPNSIVLSVKTAELLFGHTDIIGQTLRLSGVNGYHITAVVKDWPDNAHLEFTMLLPYESMIDMEPEHARDNTGSVLEDNRIASHSYTYVLLKPNQDPAKVNARFIDFVRERGDERFRENQSFSLLPVHEIHLSTVDGQPKPSANLNILYLFISIGILTLFIACINFINLATANSMIRAREVGVRKVLGAQRKLLIWQFLGESILMSLLAFIIAMVILYLTLPILNEVTGLQIRYLNQSATLIFIFVAIFLATGFLAGLYPAFYITSFRPVSILKDQFNLGRSTGGWLRKSLMGIQFVASIGFIGGSIICYLQVEYLRSRPLGFDRDLIINLPIQSGHNMNAVFRPDDVTLRQRMNSFDEGLSDHPNIISVTQSYSAPGFGAVRRNVWNDLVPQSENFYPQVLAVDYDYVETFSLKLVAGRDFDRSYGTDHLNSFLINEQAVKALGWDDPQSALGEEMELEGKKGLVVGVMKDFNFSSLRYEINPLVMEIRPGAFSYFSVKIENLNIPETISFLESKWKDFFPEKVFEYHFLDESLNELYQSESQLASTIGYFAMLAILISSFGLFGLSAFMTKQRFREIGIRKILGASLTQILSLLSKEFIQLIILAMLISLPLTWYFLKDWLAGFAYHIPFPWWVTLITGLAVTLLAFLTISVQSLRSALSNPVDAIRNE